jgi:tRNA-dihydrouridine synthase B
VRVPVVANGDIDTPFKAAEVLRQTGADAVMIGRAAQGRPWIFREVAHFLATGELLAPPLVAEVRRLLLDHLAEHHGLYGEYAGVRSARKHIAWYLRSLPGGEALRQQVNTIDSADAQLAAAADFFDALAQRMDRLPPAPWQTGQQEPEKACT